MTVITDTRVVRLQRVAARTGHQHSKDENIVEIVTKELVTAADVVSLPPGSLITLQRGPGAGLTEEGSVLNASYNEIGGVQGGQTTSVSFNSEDADVTANAVFQVEIDYAQSLSNPGEYAINYKTFQIKTYTVVPTIPGQRTQINYTWSPIREYLEWDPEDLIPDLVAFGIGPHAKSGTGDGADVLAGCNINVQDVDGYKEISLDIQSIAGEGLVVESSELTCPRLKVDVDAYQIGYDYSNNINLLVDNVQDALDIIDGYLSTAHVVHIRKFGTDAEDTPFNSVFNTNGHEYAVGKDRILVWINGITQFSPQDYTELSTTSIEFSEPVDHNDIIDIYLLPSGLGTGGEGTTDLQDVYNNSPIGDKSVWLDNGQLTFTQSQGTGSALRLISNGSTTPSLVVDQRGAGEGARVKSVNDSAAALMLQKDTTVRNTISNMAVIERTTSHVAGGQTGIGSAILTRLENTGSMIFDASKIITGTESAADSVEKTFLSIELSDSGVLTEHLRFTSDGKLGINTVAPDTQLHVQGDGYFSSDLEVFNKLTARGDLYGAPMNSNVLVSDPPSLEDGDYWFTDSGGVRKLNVRINGVTYHVLLTT